MADRLQAMRVFVAVADARSFTTAARQVGMSASVVTRVVADLELRLGAQLLHRTTRVVRLTEQGAGFLDRCRHILAEIEDAERSAQGEQARPRGCLVLSAPLLFGRMHVSAIVSRYLGLHPQVTAELRLSDRMANLVEDGIDVAIRIGNLADSDLVARTLGRTRRVLVASPGYLAGPLGTPAQPSDLAHHALIAFDAITPGRAWSFDHGDMALTVAVEPRLRTNSADAALDYAAAGGGITAALCYQVDDALRRGRLVQVLEPFAPKPLPIQAIYPASRWPSSKVRAFLDLAESSALHWRFLGRPTPIEAR